MKESLAVIIAAGGTGKRFGAVLPKQFLEVGGVPMIVQSMAPFSRYADCYVVSLAPDFADYFQGILPPDLKEKTIVVNGGATRYESVKNALAVVPERISLIAVHDAARPYVDAPTIERTIEKAQEFGAALPAVPIVDSIRRIFPDGTSSVEDRSNFVAVQTPQVFRTEILKRAYDCPYDQSFTDDASVVESMGVAVHVVQGSPENIKVTFKKDLL